MSVSYFRNERFSIPVLLLVLAGGARAQDLSGMTLGEARQKALTLRMELRDGEARFIQTVDSQSTGGEKMGHTSVGEIRFDPSAYTNTHQRSETRGYTFHYTRSDGIRHEGLDPEEDAIYVRRPAIDLTAPRLEIDRLKARFAGGTLFPQQWDWRTGFDLLALGLVVPGASLDARLDALPLALNSEGDLVGRGNIRGADVEVVVSPKQGFLIIRSSFEEAGSKILFSVEETEQTKTFLLPKRVRVTAIDKGGSESSLLSTFTDIRVNGGSKAAELPPLENQTVVGDRDNSVYRIGKDGKPIFVMKKGVVRERSAWKSYLYVGALGLLLFVATGTLIRSLARRRR